MRLNVKVLSVLLAIFLLSLPPLASAKPRFNSESEDKKIETTAPSNNNDKDEKKDTTSPNNVVSNKLTAEEQINQLNEKVRKLEEMVERQQRLLEKIQPDPANATNNAKEIKNITTTNPANASVNDSLKLDNTVAAQPAIATQTAAAPTDELTKKVDQLFKAFGKFNISGDLRLRFESLTNQGFDSVLEAPDRNRLRVRARIQLTGQLTNNFDYGIRLASGNFTNPISTNQTATDFFNRKPVGLDRYYIRYDSKTEPAGIILQAGKFDYPWKRTELTLDSDLQPEGAAETFYVRGKGAFKELKVVAFQLPFNESSTGKDSALFGGQVLATLASGNWGGSAGVTYSNYNQADALARSLSRPTTQVGGGVELPTTNRVVRDANGNIIGFLANFNIFEAIGELNYTGFKKFPISLVLNYARNVSGRLDKFGERNGYWAEFKVGRLKEKGDVELGYTFNRIEQDAVLSPLNFSDMLIGTNNRVSKVSAGYMVNNNVYFQLVGIFPERFNTVGRDSRTARIFQFDVNYKF